MNRRLDQERWFRTAALLLALFAVFLMGIGASYWHRDTPGSEASCPICHVSHMPILVVSAAILHIASTTVARVVPADVQASHSAAVGLDSPPRAPPA
jgi:hypothetical protein